MNKKGVYVVVAFAVLAAGSLACSQKEPESPPARIARDTANAKAAFAKADEMSRQLRMAQGGGLSEDDEEDSAGADDGMATLKGNVFWTGGSSFGITITLIAGNGSTYATDTDSTGRYSVNVPPGVYTLLINDPCCKPIKERVPVDAELNADYSINLENK